MRILYMSHRYHTNQATIMKGWIENGHEVRFLSHARGSIEDYSYIKPVVLGYSKVYEAILWVYVNIFKRKDPSAIDARLKSGFPPIFKLEKNIRNFSPDVAIMRERSVYTICMNVLCKLYGIPTILYVMNPVWDVPKKMDLAHRIVWKLTPKYRITPSELIGIERNNLVKDENAFFAPYLMEPQVSPENKEYFYNNRVNILCVGKYQERKNHHLMLEVFEKLVSKYDIHLTIVGELSSHFHEEYYARIEEYVLSHGLSSSVTLLKNLNRTQMFEEYKKADICTVPSTGEPGAVTLLEAMAYSIPVIGGSNNGTASYIVQGKTGYVFKDNDTSDLQDKLETIVADKELLISMGKEAYNHVLENFQFDSYFKTINRVLSQIEEDKKMKRR